MTRHFGFLATLGALLGLAACGGGLQSPDFTSVLKGVEITAPVTPAAVNVGQTLNLRATGLFSVPPGSATDAVRRDVTGVTWSSDTPGVATVDANGVVTGVRCAASNAPAVIRAKVNNVEGTIRVQVGGEVLRQVSVSPTTRTIRVGETADYAVNGVYQTCSGAASSRTTITQAVTWSLSNANVGQVTPNGANVSVLGRTVSTGVRVIANVVNEEGQTLTADAGLVVNPAILRDLVVTGVGISPPFRVPVGGALTFEVNGVFSDSATPRPVPTDTNPVTWTSGRPTLATFSAAQSNNRNTLTANARDTANTANNNFNITVSAPNGEGGTVTNSQPAQITITDALLQAVSDIRVVPTDLIPLRVANGASVQLQAFGTFTDGSVQGLDNSVVSWAVAAGASPAGTATITNSNPGANPPVLGGLLAGTAIGNINVTATANSAIGNKVVTEAARVTDPICVQPFVAPSATAVGAPTANSTSCLTGCAVRDAGNVVTPSNEDFAIMNLGAALAQVDLNLTVTGPTVTATPGQRAGFIIAYEGTDFNPDNDFAISVGGGAFNPPEVSSLSPTSGGLTRRLVQVPVTGDFNSIAGRIRIPPIVGLNGLLNPTGLLNGVIGLLLAGGTIDIQVTNACAASQAPVAP
jgi:hypothetical protein